MLKKKIPGKKLNVNWSSELYGHTSFYYALLYCSLQILLFSLSLSLFFFFFLQVEGWWLPSSGKAIFPTISSLCVRVTFLCFLQHFKLSSYYMCYDDLWPVIFMLLLQKDYNLLKAPILARIFSFKQ